MEGLNLDNILDPEQINDLFNGTQEDTPPPAEPTGEGEEQPEDENNNNETDEITDVPINELFGNAQESVGNESNEETKEKENTPPTEKKGNSSNFYSSIAKALKDEGVFPDLDDVSVNGSDSAEKFKELIKKQIESGLDETQKRVNEALNLNIEPDVIKQNEQGLKFLNSIKEEDFNDASGEKGEELRKNLIYNDFINRGYSEERAKKEVKKSFDAGTDFEDAKEALAGNIEFYKKKYDALIEAKKQEVEKKRKEEEEINLGIRKDILEGKDAFEGFSTDAKFRETMINNMSKATIRTKDGRMVSPLQHYQEENTKDFIKKIGFLYTITDGFKTLDRIVNFKAKKEINRGFKELEAAMSTSTNNIDGGLKFVTPKVDENANFNNWDFDI